MRISTGTNDITVLHRPNGGICLEQGRSHILLNRGELRRLADAISELLEEPILKVRSNE
jgi:hypothetical protein